MTEAERLRAQAERCTQLAREATDQDIITTLLGLAAKSLEQANELETLAAKRRVLAGFRA
jgi:hypothetical protein